ncbi:MAG TPA: hypothetical protein VN958_08235 [Chitinophagaceae bacterium]|nr:hypothetical protein [Chitinophagaceae bacterium]
MSISETDTFLTKEGKTDLIEKMNKEVIDLINMDVWFLDHYYFIASC